jgi:hypothetical protein
MRKVLENIKDDIVFYLKEKKLNISDNDLISEHFGKLLFKNNLNHTIEIAFHPAITKYNIEDIFKKIENKYLHYILKINMINKNNNNYYSLIRIKITLRTKQEIRKSKIKDILNIDDNLNIRKEYNDSDLEKVIKFQPIILK